MTGHGRRFDPSELSGADGVELGDAELAEALATARTVEAGIAPDNVYPSGGFEDRVMVAIAREPAPRVGASFGGRGFLAAIAGAWQIATTGGRPLAARMQAVALVIVVGVVAASLAGIGVAGVGSLLSQTPAPTSTFAPAPITPSPSISPSPSVSPSASPSPSPTPTPTPDPTATSEPTETPRPTETVEPDETAEPTDDNSGPGGGSSGPDDDNSGPGGGGPGSG